MKEINALNSNSTLKLYIQQESLLDKLRDEIERVEHHFISQQIREVVEENYDLGKVVGLFEIFGGYTSRAFKIIMEKSGRQKNWFFRKYIKSKPESEVLFEHDLLLYAKNNGFLRGAAPIQTKEGKTYVSVTQGEGDYELQHYFTVYESLQGREPYDWVRNEMPRESYIGIAEIVAEFHNAVCAFDNKNRGGTEPPILEFVKELPDRYLFYLEEYSDAGVQNCFTEYLRENFDYLAEMARKLEFSDETIERLPVIPIQCDLHPGNFKFTGNKCTGVFDFEAAKMDIRLFEIALGVFNCFSSWRTGTDGVIDLKKAEEFLHAYDDKLRQLKSGLPPLNDTEKINICEALQLSNLYLIRWCAKMYHMDMTKNHYEYFYYLEHMIRSMEWVEDNKGDILEMMKRL
jgi:homoserine kinase type II